MRPAAAVLALVATGALLTGCGSGSDPGSGSGSGSADAIVVSDLAASDGVDAVRVTGDPVGIPGADHDNEVDAAVYYPAGSDPTKGVVLVQHGGHTVCRAPQDAWPCATASDRTPSLLGYGYLAEALVREGWVVVSMGANGTVGAADVSGEPALIGYWEEVLQQADDGTGPLGSRLRGRVHLADVVLVGHSRGGDAVAQALLTSAGAPGARPVAAAVLLAPVLPVEGGVPPETSEVPTLTVVGTCDGDAGRDGVRYSRDFTSPASRLVTVTGANHNFYNTEWTPGTGVADAVDDADQLADPACRPGSPTRLTVEEQHATVVRLVSRFLAQP